MRWKMERAGIFNFWYYDDQEFYFSDGRLILRGSNGSGKSVTMQSFIPLVLDGDKRPWRLDPFGSRDRRIEYYLLGETDSGIHDRTGYLYLEFRHAESGKTLTIGIGMRARKGISGLGFWGFVLQDGRRIGKDFFLYDYDHYRKYGEKIPLHRDKLIAQIGVGGKLVREQAAYRKLVNQVLFGFDDEESYQELLDLLIQLRSPKLSKDFKPSTIYNILTDALPPLKEEELRPLSDVLEDMDQINDTLDELMIHRKEIERLNDGYAKYNEYLFYEASSQLRRRQKEFENKKNDIDAIRQELAEYTQNVVDLQEQKEQATEKENELTTEIELLEQHEAIEKHKELEQAKNERQEITMQINNTKQRIAEVKARLEKNKIEQEETEKQAQRQEKLSTECMEDMEVIARDAEFTEHDLYHRQFEQQHHLEEGNWQAWKTDVANHGKRLQEALVLSQKEERAKERVQEAEAAMSEAREERDERERLLRQAEKQLQDTMSDYEDRFYQWFQSLKTLPLAEQTWRDLLHLLSGYPNVSYPEIKQPAINIYEETKEKWQVQMTQIQHQQGLLQEEKSALEEELYLWDTKKDPEPERRSSRESYRQKRKENQEGAGSSLDAGAPLYACCDFKQNLSDEEKARLESVLEYTGLLDAWIGPTQIVTEGSVWHEDIEEFMILPEPVSAKNDIGTLADVLQPELSDDMMISEEEVWNVLRTIRFEREHLKDERLEAKSDSNRTGSWVNHQGQFQLGALFGQVEVKPKAQLIGKNAREKMRMEMIEHLRNQIVEVEAKIQENGQKQQEIRLITEQLKEEIENIPSEEELLHAERTRRDARLDLEQAQKHLEKMDQQYRSHLGQWRQLQQDFKVYTDRWSRLKNRSLIEQAIADMQAYHMSLGELRSAVQILFTHKQRLNRLLEDIEACEEQQEREEEQHTEWKRKQRETEHKIETLTRLLDELGILNIYERLEEVKQQRNETSQLVQRLDANIRDVEIKKAKYEERVNIMKREFGEIETLRNQAVQYWQAEWERKLLTDWEDEWKRDNLDISVMLMLAKKAEQRYQKKYQTKPRDKAVNELLDMFNEVKNMLLDYVLESHYDEQHQRWLIHSVRDRQHPLSPGKLLEELILLEEEQKQLMDEKDRELYEQIILHSVGKAIRHKIYRAEQWVKQMNRLMDERKTSSGLKLSLKWEPRPPRNETELDVDKLVTLLRKDPELLRDDEVAQMVDHFRSRIRLAKSEADEKESLRKWIADFLDYRQWFDFVLYYKKGEQNRRVLTDSRFNVLSGGEKAMSMYIPLFAATYSRYNDSNPDSPKIISLDEAFAGVDEENIRDLFQLLTDMDFDYMMTSQVLWGCFDTVPNLSIYEIIRPKDVDFVTLLRYHWNGYRREMVLDEPLSDEPKRDLTYHDEEKDRNEAPKQASDQITLGLFSGDN
ncbi:TIGR02680 family protein [Pueribacillus theae]|uniref:TIGR02680 family protein n=1 Tax=Pueribacillus theae TaxID=2171751 RepID=A0A2U1K8C5_9BACI|nr:TIGR02680 family protein [Pueribacillus theae]PWA13433.1 TIGR02680 family protein [Pueribacillus theae]